MTESRSRLPTGALLACTQVLPHRLEVVQIVRHGVGEVHKDVQVHRALQGLKHLQVELSLLAGPKPGPKTLRGHLASA